MIELRYVVKEGIRTLQHRQLIDVIDYSSYNPESGKYYTNKLWTEWKNIPEVEI